MRRLSTIVRALLAAAACGCLGLSLPAAAAAGIHKEDFVRFENCPIEQGRACVYSEVLKGEFKLGNKAVPLTVPTVLQGGLESAGFGAYPLIPPRFGAATLSKSPQPVPGGLTGLTETIGGPVYATAELAGTATVSPVALGYGNINPHSIAVQLPIKVHLENELLGPNCYIGSESEPIVLNLTDGTTQPPEGTEPIEGAVGKNEGLDHGEILAFFGNKLVDNTFAAPAAKNCGTNPLTEAATTLLVNTAEGLPSAAGKNVAIMEGNAFTSFSTYVGKYDKKIIKQKEKEQSGKPTRRR